MTPLAFHVADWAAWSPHRQDRAAWLDWAGLPACEQRSEQPIPVTLRRRVTKIGQQALRAAWPLSDRPDTRIVFASRDGEFSRTASVMDTLTDPDLVSPADFSLSVHHALAGLLSIARDNHAGHGAVAAGRDSLWCGLIEAAASLTGSANKFALLVYHAEPLPPPYESFTTPDDETIALAVLLTATADGTGLRLSTAPLAADIGAPPPGEAFLSTLLRGGRATVPGERLVWNLDRSDAHT